MVGGDSPDSSSLWMLEMPPSADRRGNSYLTLSSRCGSDKETQGNGVGVRDSSTAHLKVMGTGIAAATVCLSQPGHPHPRADTPEPRKGGSLRAACHGRGSASCGPTKGTSGRDVRARNPGALFRRPQSTHCEANPRGWVAPWQPVVCDLPQDFWDKGPGAKTQSRRRAGRDGLYPSLLRPTLPPGAQLPLASKYGAAWAGGLGSGRWGCGVWERGQLWLTSSSWLCMLHNPGRWPLCSRSLGSRGGVGGLSYPPSWRGAGGRIRSSCAPVPPSLPWALQADPGAPRCLPHAWWAGYTGRRQASQACVLLDDALDVGPATLMSRAQSPHSAYVGVRVHKIFMSRSYGGRCSGQLKRAQHWRRTGHRGWPPTVTWLGAQAQE